jgi:hypothetical protein
VQDGIRIKDKARDEQLLQNIQYQLIDHHHVIIQFLIKILPIDD